MLEKVKQFLKGKKQIEQPAQPVQAAKPVQQPDVVENYSVNQNVEVKKQSDIALQDEKLLGHFVLYSEYIAYSTAVKGPCIYVHAREEKDACNISGQDIVQRIYAEHKVNLKKHVSHLDHKETEVLYISIKSYCEELDKESQEFFDKTRNRVISWEHLRFDSDVCERNHDIWMKIAKERDIIAH